MAERFYNLTDQSAMFKDFYAESSEAAINKKTPLASILLKDKKADWVGKQFVKPIRFGFGTGLGYRSRGQNLPAPQSAKRDQALFPAKRAYATCEFDREAIVASRNDRGAFAKATVDEVEATVEGFNVHMLERALFGNASGVLGEMVSVTGAGTTASPWVILMDTAPAVATTPKYKKNYFPRGAKLDLFTSAGVYGMTIQVVSADSTSVTATTVATGAVVTPVAGDLFYWEGNRNQEIVGLGLICPASAGTIYGLSQTDYPEMRGGYRDLSGGALSYDDLNNAVESAVEESGVGLNLGVCSHRAFSLLKNLSEDLKRYNTIEVKSFDGKAGFKGIEIVHGEGSFAMIPSQMCPNDDMYFLNTDHLQLVMRQDFGWFDDDGSVFLRDPNKDLLASRYGGYFELFCDKPQAQYRLTGFQL